MKVFEGKSGIKAAVICDSISKAGIRLTTFEIEYPRIIHSELMTHRMLSRNAASSRAIPAAKMFEQLTAMPVRFGANVSGMQDTGTDHDVGIQAPLRAYMNPTNGNTNCLVHVQGTINVKTAWQCARDMAKLWSKTLSDAGYHKQVFNRLTEPFQMIKVVVTATEWDNFFWLRNDSAADPTLHELARLMQEARNESVPQPLKAGEWHLPYVETYRHAKTNELVYMLGEPLDGCDQDVSLEDAIKVSCARSAAVSFRNVDYGVEKSREVYDRLVGADRKHASALEHTATPMSDEHLPRDTISTIAFNVPHCPETWQKGISHMDRNRQLWSGNLKGWLQHRKTLDGENYTGD